MLSTIYLNIWKSTYKNKKNENNKQDCKYKNISTNNITNFWFYNGSAHYF